MARLSSCVGSASAVFALVVVMATVFSVQAAGFIGDLGDCEPEDPCAAYNQSFMQSFMGIEPDYRIEGSTFANGVCDSTRSVGHFALVFDFAEFYIPQDMSRWGYHLEWDRVDPELDRLAIMICRAEYLGGCPDPSEIIIDPDGITWVVWDNLPAGSHVNIVMQIRGVFDMQVGQTDFELDAGAQHYAETTCGIPCGEPADCEVEITCPADVTVDCIDPTDPSNTGEPTYWTDCPDTPVVWNEDETVPGLCPDEYTIERTWIAMTRGGEADSCLQRIEVVDDTPPTLDCAEDEVIPCEAQVIFTPPEVSDVCDPDPDINIISTGTVPGPDPYEYTHTRCWEGIDRCGNADTCCQHIYEEPCEEGEYCTYTMGGWGSPCTESQEFRMMSTQPGCIRDHYFFDVYGSGGVWVGDPDHHDSDTCYAANWRDEEAVEAYLPAGSTAGRLGGDYTDPAKEDGNVLVSQILALRLNVDFSCAGIFDSLGLLPDVGCYSGLEIPDGCIYGVTYFEGMTVGEFLAFADLAVCGEPLPPGVSYSDINETATCMNELWHECEEAVDEPEPISPTGMLFGQSADNANHEIEQLATEVPTELRVSSHPNPMQGSTTIKYSLPFSAKVTIEVYDIHGKKVNTLLSTNKNAGFHGVVWNGKDNQGNTVISGVYFCRVQIDDRPAILEKLIKM
jgi:hypothetical protein